MKKINVLPNMITALGLSFGLFIIFKITVTDVEREDFFGVLSILSGLLILAIIADFLDGAIARLLKLESEFGVLFDSLSDVVSFGVAPAVVILKSLPLKPGSDMLFLVTIGTLVFSMCGVLRLVRYNVTLPKDHESEEWAVYAKNFTGLPIPAAAAAAMSANLFFLSKEFIASFALTKEIRAATMVIIMIFLGYLMVSRWKFPSLKTVHFKMRSFSLVFVTVIFSLTILYGVFHRFAIAFFVLSWGYIALAALLSTIRMIIGKKSKTLTDFDPDSPE